MPFLALLFEYGERQGERSDVRNMRHVGRVQVVFLGVHIHERAFQRPEDPFHEGHRVGVAALRVAQYGDPAREGAPLCGLRTAVLRAPHRMGGDETSAAGVHRDDLAQLALDRPHVHDHLPVRRAVERLDGHDRNGVHGGGQHHQVGLGDSLFESHDPVRETQPHRLLGDFRRFLHAENLFGERTVAQRQGERASDEAQARYHRFHTYL